MEKVKLLNESLIFARLLIGLEICWSICWPQTHERKLEHHGASLSLEKRACKWSNKSNTLKKNTLYQKKAMLNLPKDGNRTQPGPGQCGAANRKSGLVLNLPLRGVQRELLNQLQLKKWKPLKGTVINQSIN